MLLLAVLAVIIVLALTLLPALTKAKAAAKRIQHINNEYRKWRDLGMVQAKSFDYHRHNEPTAIDADLV